jgi:hypothetical protein
MVAVGVLVAVGVGVRVAVAVDVRVEVAVTVPSVGVMPVAVAVGVRVAVAVFVRVAVAVAVGVCVGVGRSLQTPSFAQKLSLLGLSGEFGGQSRVAAIAAMEWKRVPLKVTFCPAANAVQVWNATMPGPAQMAVAFVAVAVLVFVGVKGVAVGVGVAVTVAVGVPFVGVDVGPVQVPSFTHQLSLLGLNGWTGGQSRSAGINTMEWYTDPL